MRGLGASMIVAGAVPAFGAGSAEALEAGFSDGFDYFDEARWSKGSHRLGRSVLDPANVSVGGGALRVRIPARTTNGGEIFSDALYGYGSYTARIRAANAPSSITGFFLYASPDFESELDVEVFNDATGRVMFTTYAGGGTEPTNTVTKKVVNGAGQPIDLTAAFHDYRFDYAPGSVRFFVDGAPLQEFDRGLPAKQMHLMVNTWFPTWLNGRRPNKDAHTVLDSISYAP